MLKSPHCPRRYILIGILGAALLPSQTIAADNPLLEEIVISAARSSTSAFELPYSSHRIDQQQIQQRQPRNSLDMLREIPGVLLQKTANGQGSPYIRGFTGYRTLLMIDGVRYNNSVYRDGSNQYFSLIDSGSLAGIELLSGPAATLYGSDAIGGTITMQSRSAVQSRSAIQSQTAADAEDYFINGRQQYRYASAESSHTGRTELAMGKIDEWGLLAGLSYKNFGNVDAAKIGNQPKTGYREQATDLRLDKKINTQWSLTALHQSLTQDDVWRTHATVFAKSFADTTIGSDQRRSKDQRRSLNYLKINGRELSENVDDIELTLSHQRWREDGQRIKADGQSIIEYFDSTMSGIDLRLRSSSDYFKWVYGADYYRDSVDSGRRDYFADGSLGQIRIQGPVGDDSRYSLLGAYVQAEWIASEYLTLLVGSRFTQTQAYVGAFEDPVTNTAASYSDSWNSTVSSLRASYHLRPQWQLWGGVSQSFRAPNIADLSRFGTSRSNELEVASTDLNAEKFISYEIGSRVHNDNAQWSASYFYTDISEFIISSPTGVIVDGLIQVSKQNSAGGYIQGIETSGDYSINHQWQASAGFTWLAGEFDQYIGTTDTASASIVTEPFSRIMPVTGHIALQWTDPSGPQWLRLAITHSAKADQLSSGDMQDSQRIPPGGTPAYTLVNISAGRQLSRNIDLNMQLNNLFDEAYRTHGSGSNEAGLGIVVGFSLSF